MTSPWGFRFFFLDIIYIWVLFTLRVSLLESNLSATLANSELRIWIAPSIESCWTYCGSIVITVRGESVTITGVTSRGSAYADIRRLQWGSEDCSYRHSVSGVHRSRIIRLFPVGVAIVAGHPIMLWPIDWNKFQWLSDSGELQGYSLSSVKRETIGSSIVVSTKVNVGSSFAS